MIISTAAAKAEIEALAGWTDEKVTRKLQAVEQAIRAYTNNNFQARAFRVIADIRDGAAVFAASIPFKIGDTVEISESLYNSGLYTIKEITAGGFTVNEDTIDEHQVLITKISYPADVVDCALNLMRWEATNRDKVGVKSETLSRHSVTYFDLDANNQVMGYPVSLLGGLKAYKKARF